MNIKKIFFLLVLGCLFVQTSFAQNTMSDEQIMSFVARERAKNTPNSQIVTLLIERGVSIDRIRKIKEKYEKQKNKTIQGAINISGIDKKTESRLRKNNGEKTQEQNPNFKHTAKETENEIELSDYEKERLKIKRRKAMRKELDFVLEDSIDYDEIEEEYLLPKKKEKQVFGRNIFKNKELTFEPEMNIATPSDYRLGAGDAVYVDIWGASQKQYIATVSPEGVINIENFGPIQVSGMTVGQANNHVRSILGQRFGGSNIKLTVGQTKTITVNVMGEVEHPGTYTLSAFATVFHALYMAGGTNEIGTMRSIKVYRNNKLISNIDLYDYILNGNLKGNVRLASNDVIVVGAYECLVNITGKVKRPMFYEMKTSESVATLLKYAGGFTGDAYEDQVKLVRKNGGLISVYTLGDFERGKFQLMDADSISVDSVLNRYKNMVDLRGAVMRPGLYQMDGNISTVRQLIETAGGLTEDAMTTHGLIHRRKEDRTLMTERFNIGALLNHSAPDIALRNEDAVFIPSRKDLNEELTLSIEGEVRYPGKYQFSENTTIESFILQAGGLTDKASLAKVDVSRRIRDKKAMVTGNQMAEFFTFSLKEGFVIDGESNFILQPFDEVFVRTSPGYYEQQHVIIEGEVPFAGRYTITKKNTRLSDLVQLAGGVTKDAFLEGARLERQMTDIEKLKQQEIIKISSINDSTDVRKIHIGEQKNVGIHLEKALANPGSNRWDIILKDGDRLIIPQFDNTVSISGEVMFPNTVAYKPGANLSYYINQCGGYSLKAKERRTFAVHMNGTVGRVRSSKDIKPGSNIVVPAKRKSNIPFTSWVSLSMTIATLAAVVVSAFKK
ncbi:capsule biosynthesis protein [Alloprevotella sp. OH1205_COT-284]|uniref:SLBB domain-containing protein n=1 Tax=Alloprevotella sp. OH1205_COT-284 TaxID=2491043 RepID=UPI000F5FD69F|nr:SLBB domain-containing protein [Alloprevotella sp. OH1205_COT-284]RRD79493.1 capsule biosynthesis protein [Alloprevotella sp. OH1205_COT-284]